MAKRRKPAFPLKGRHFASMRHVESKESSVTTEWGVNWDEEMIARDLMQNFFDANQDNIDAIAITRKGSRLTIEAPTEFDLQRLFY